jgi:prepilin-type N-terminal cleavage/methylation domain-containing protein
MARRIRFAFTLIELLVVVGIIGALLALLLPAIGSTKETTRKLQCSNKLRNIGMEIINFATRRSGTLPGYVQPIKRNDKKYVVWDGIGGEVPLLWNSKYGSTTDIMNSRVSWAVPILPYLEHEDIWDRIVDGINFPGDDQATRLRPIGDYICPDDTDLTTSPDKAGMTYVANTGAWDFRLYQTYPPIFSEDDYFANLSKPASPKGDTRANGLFQNLTFTKENNRLDNIPDGTTMTIMLSENIHKNYYYSWLGVAGVRPNWDGGEQQFGMVWVPSTAPKSGDTLKDQERFSSEVVGTDPIYILRGGPWFCRPASSHAMGSFNVIFADGHGASMLPELDYIVYQQLLTTNGRKCVDSENWNDTSVTSKFRSAPPLSESSYK